MKKIVIGDIHGRELWRDIVAREEDADKIIFLGDYVDTHENITPIQQVENLRRICKFASSRKDQVVLLLGNHDYHYLPGIDEHCSGYQPMMKMSFEYEYRKYNHLFKLAYQDEMGYLYTHAGLTNTFYHNLTSEKPIAGADSPARILNKFFKQNYRGFGFYPGDLSGYGKDKRQSCIWVRPQALVNDFFPVPKQFVGHTSFGGIRREIVEGGRELWLCDALVGEGEYVEIIDSTVTIKR